MSPFLALVRRARQLPHDAGQATVEYGLILICALLIAFAGITWARGDVIGQLFEAVGRQLLSAVG